MSFLSCLRLMETAEDASVERAMGGTERSSGVISRTCANTEPRAAVTHLLLFRSRCMAESPATPPLAWASGFFIEERRRGFAPLGDSASSTVSGTGGDVDSYVSTQAAA